LPGEPRLLAPDERFADAVVHIAGLALGIAACLVLAALALPGATPAEALAALAYAFGLLAMLGCSALYHLTREPARKRRFRRLDHAAIFLMIAGTYTPLLAIGVGGRRTFLLLALIWSVALAGVAIKLLALRLPEWLSVALYLALGWTIVLAPGEMAAALSSRDLTLLVAGGILYSVGVLFYAWERLRFHTAIWHGFVLAAAGCHYVVVLELANGQAG
jgi:hemolysin III